LNPRYPRGVHWFSKPAASAAHPPLRKLIRTGFYRVQPSASKDKLSARAIGRSECVVPPLRIRAGRATTVRENLREQIHLRGDGFIGQNVSKGGEGFRVIPRVLRRVGRPALETIVTTPEDTAGAAEPTLDHGVTLNEIASHLEVQRRGETPGATARSRAERHWGCVTAGPRHPEAACLHGSCGRR
jgi:hypothetical protein